MPGVSRAPDPLRRSDHPQVVRSLRRTRAGDGAAGRARRHATRRRPWRRRGAARVGGRRARSTRRGDGGHGVASSSVASVGCGGASSFSAARRRALEARGLAATSASGGVQDPALSRRTVGCTPLGGGRWAGPVQPPVAAWRKPRLHDAVLAGVVREHRAAAARLQGGEAGVDGGGQHVELGVHRDADGLEACAWPGDRRCGGPAPGWRRGRSRPARWWWRRDGRRRSPWRCGGRSARRRRLGAGRPAPARRCSFTTSAAVRAWRWSIRMSSGASWR